MIPEHTRTEDVIYGRKYGTALTMDVFAPAGGANGLGVIFVVSGGWFSDHQLVNPEVASEMLRRGYTVFEVVHGSQPKFTIPEILGDIHRAVRFIRHHAKEHRIDPERIGVYGWSAGGHLSLMQGVTGLTGDPSAHDPVDRASSRVQAVGCFFPPTDFLNYGGAGSDGIGRGVLKDFRAPFDFHDLDPATNSFVPVTGEERIRAIARDISPIYHVTPGAPPTLILHGDLDALVPIEQSQRMIETLRRANVPAELVVKTGGDHGWAGMEEDLVTIADWFDRHLRPGPRAAPSR